MTFKGLNESEAHAFTRIVLKSFKTENPEAVLRLVVRDIFSGKPKDFLVPHAQIQSGIIRHLKRRAIADGLPTSGKVDSQKKKRVH